MGLLKPWTSKYPGSIDDKLVGGFEAVADGVDDVIATHPNELSLSVIELEQENIGFKDNLQFSGVTEAFVDDDERNVDLVLGAVLFDAADLEHLVATFRLIGMFDAGAGAGDAELRLYDIGAPGTPLLPPVLRSTVSIPNANGGEIIHVSQVLTPSGSPGVDSNEVFTSTRIYEIRANLVSPTVGDTMKIHWGGLSLGVSQP